LEDLAAGHRTAAAAVPTKDGLVDDAALPVSSGDGGQCRLSGSVRHVLGAAGAEHIVVLAAQNGRPQLYLVERDQPGVTITAQPVLDATRPMATVGLDAATARQLPAGRPVGDIVGDSLRYAIAVLTAEQVGATERVLEMAVEYARVREQFDRPIGSFQVIKHKCADMLVELEMARSASLAAVEAVDSADPDAPWLVSMAKAVCSETLRSAAHANLQIHGGIGFTWEHAVGLYVKRARTDEVLFGSPAGHWRVLEQSAALTGVAS
jgi:alkylation response protein AidB-like acyl-CoA dehydrogenase